MNRLAALFCLSPILYGAGSWTWFDREGNERTKVELDHLVRLHQEWLKNSPAGEDRYGSGNALQLPGAELRRVDWTGEHLGYANFSDAKFRYGHFPRADLRSVIFANADLRDVELREANLSEADLQYALLRGADLVGADMTMTHLYRTDLTGAIYEPKVNPSPEKIAFAVGLGKLTFDSNPAPLISLRNSFKEAGFDNAARQVTAALHRNEQTWLERAVFDWTCEWGANWLRPLTLVGCFSVVFGFMYWLGMHFSNKSRLYLVATGQRVPTSKAKERVIGIRFRPPRPAKRSRYVLSFVTSELRALGTAFLFSLMSVFNIGFREFNFGRWIRVLQPREFDIRAQGWMRTISGIQSLLGLALVALSLLSYFGHPFD